MNILYRILLVIILIAILMVVILDYVGFHGSIFLEKIGNGTIVYAIDHFLLLFQGPNGTANILYMTVLGACVSVGLIGIMYKFVKG